MSSTPSAAPGVSPVVLAAQQRYAARQQSIAEGKTKGPPDVPRPLDMGETDEWLNVAIERSRLLRQRMTVLSNGKYDVRIPNERLYEEAFAVQLNELCLDAGPEGNWAVDEFDALARCVLANGLKAYRGRVSLQSMLGRLDDDNMLPMRGLMPALRMGSEWQRVRDAIAEQKRAAREEESPDEGRNGQPLSEAEEELLLAKQAEQAAETEAAKQRLYAEWRKAHPVKAGTATTPTNGMKRAG